MANDDWRAADCVEWIYPRKEGDIEVYARTREEAAIALLHHGFRNVDPAKFIRGVSNLTDHIAIDSSLKGGDQ